MRSSPVCPLRSIALAVLCALLAGCAGNGTPSTALYTLPVTRTPMPTYEAKGLETVVIGNIELPRYLSREGIVMQLSEVEVQQARNHLWAGPLSQQLERTLQQHLQTALPDTRIIEDPPRADASRALRVDVEIDAFQGRYDGSAVVSGAWQVRGGNGEVLSRQSFDIEQVLDADGYPALVKSLAQAWAEVSTRLAGDLAGLQ